MPVAVSTGDAVRDAIASLNLGGEVRTISDDESRDVLRELAGVFVRDPGATWWWKSLVDHAPSATHEAPGNGHQRIPDICPDEPGWFVVTDDQETGWSVFEARPSAVAAILGECPFFEYFVASKTLHWIVFENHDNVIIGVGEPVVARINLLAAR